MANGSPGGGAAGSFEQRLQALEDEREIRELVVRYAQRLDARDHRGYAQLFAREGRWSGRMGDATVPEAIESMLIEGLGQPPEGFRNTRNFHLMSNILIEIDGDTARAELRLVYFARSKEARPVPMLAGRYLDELVREDGRWRFKFRQVIGEIPTREEAPVRTPEEEGHLLVPTYHVRTLVIWLGTMAGAFCLYLMVSWLPTVLTAARWSTADALRGTAAVQLGGIMGSLLIAAAIDRRQLLLGLVRVPGE